MGFSPPRYWADWYHYETQRTSSAVSVIRWNPFMWEPRRYPGIILTFSQLQPLPSLFVSCSYEAAVVPPKPTHSRHLLALFLRSGKLLADSEPRWNPLHPTFYLFHAVLRSLHLSHTNSFSPINVIIINKEGNRNKKKTIFFFVCVRLCRRFVLRRDSSSRPGWQGGWCLRTTTASPKKKLDRTESQWCNSLQFVDCFGCCGP